jgi:hypothetical protein
MAGEDGLAGVGVQLYELGDGIDGGTATTDANGYYSIDVDPLWAFYGLEYRVEFSTSAGHEFSTTIGADNDIAVGIGVAGQTAPFTLMAGTNYTFNAAALASSSAPVVVRLEFDGSDWATTTTDSGPLSQTVTMHGATLTTSGPHAGTACATLPGTSNNRVEVAAHASMIFGSSDFSVSGWCNADATQPNAYPVLFETYNPSAGNNWHSGALSICASRAEYPGKVTVFCHNYDNGSPLLVSTSTVIGAGWKKWELRRVGNTFTLLIGGVSEATQTFTGAVNSHARPYFFGGDENAGANPAVAFKGKLDNCIVTIG